MLLAYFRSWWCWRSLIHGAADVLSFTLLLLLTLHLIVAALRLASCLMILLATHLMVLLTPYLTVLLRMRANVANPAQWKRANRAAASTEELSTLLGRILHICEFMEEMYCTHACPDHPWLEQIGQVHTCSGLLKSAQHVRMARTTQLGQMVTKVQKCLDVLSFVHVTQLIKTTLLDTLRLETARLRRKQGHNHWDDDLLIHHHHPLKSISTPLMPLFLHLDMSSHISSPQASPNTGTELRWRASISFRPWRQPWWPFRHQRQPSRHSWWHRQRHYECVSKEREQIRDRVRIRLPHITD